MTHLVDVSQLVGENLPASVSRRIKVVTSLRDVVGATPICDPSLISVDTAGRAAIHTARCIVGDIFNVIILASRHVFRCLLRDFMASGQLMIENMQIIGKSPRRRLFDVIERRFYLSGSRSIPHRQHNYSAV